MDEREINVGGTEPSGNGRTKASRFESVKQGVADRLHDAAGALRNRTGSEDDSGLGRYGHQASDMLDRSAEYVRQFDYARANAQVRNYVRQNPGRSLLMAGAAGLIIGVLARRR
jgi:ElaB/YqjD/DUF883 family membrane-anchored ribosome-binding protein